MTEAQLDGALSPSTNPLTSRKFMLAVFVVVAATALLWLGKLPASDWVWVVLGAPTGYGTLNVIEKKVAP